MRWIWWCIIIGCKSIRLVVIPGQTFYLSSIIVRLDGPLARRAKRYRARGDQMDPRGRRSQWGEGARPRGAPLSPPTTYRQRGARIFTLMAGRRNETFGAREYRLYYFCGKGARDFQPCEPLIIREADLGILTLMTGRLKDKLPITWLNSIRMHLSEATDSSGRGLGNYHPCDRVPEGQNSYRLGRGRYGIATNIYQI